MLTPSLPRAPTPLAPPTSSAQPTNADEKGGNVKLMASAADTGSEVALKISLKGLAQALDRAAALGK